MGMIIKELKNPLTEEYLSLKKHILGTDFFWICKLTSRKDEGIIFFSHCILAGPNINFPAPRVVSDQYYKQVVLTLKDIFHHNNIEINSIIRININCTLNMGGGIACPKHYDHEFKHKNLLIYLNNAAGPTAVIDADLQKEEYFHPREDAIITFEGEHYHYQPNIGERRIVLVATYI